MNQPFYLEVWAAAGGFDAGLSSAYADLVFDPRLLTVERIVHGGAFPLLVRGSLDDRAGVVLSLGGSALEVDASEVWVRVAVLRVRGTASGSAPVVLDSSGSVFGVTVSGRFGNLDGAQVTYGSTTVRIDKPVTGRGGTDRPAGRR